MDTSALVGAKNTYLVTSDNVCKEGEKLDLNCHKVHICLLVEVGACSVEEGEEEAATISLLLVRHVHKEQ